MSQPIIDPAKVDAWSGSVREVFASGALGVWLPVGIGLLFIGVVVTFAVLEARRPRHHGIWRS